MTFEPPGIGSFADIMEVNFQNGAGPQTRTLNVEGEGVSAAVLTIAEAEPYIYLPQTVDSSVVYIFNVVNSGGIAASGLSVTSLAEPFRFAGTGGLPGTFPGVGGDCLPTGLAAGANCDLAIEYLPTTTGLHLSSLDLSYNDGVTTQIEVQGLRGTSLSRALITISEVDPYEYGVVATGGGFADHIFTVTNTGATDATGFGITGLTGLFTDTATGTCTGLTTLAAGTDCTIEIRYTPTVSGVDTGSFVASYNDGVDPQTSERQLRGEGAAPALLTISDGPTYDFGIVAETANRDHTFEVENTGEVAASLLSGAAFTNEFSFKGGGYPGVGGDCTSDLAPSSTCNIVVVFSPTSVGAQTDTITINYNNGVGAVSVPRDVEGLGATVASIAITNTNPEDFGSVAVGSISERTFTCLLYTSPSPRDS